VRGTAPHPNWFRLAAGLLLRWYGRFLFFWVLVFLLALAFADDRSPSDTGGASDLVPVAGFAADRMSGAGNLQAWLALALPLVLAWAVATRRGMVSRALTSELSRERFRDVAGDPAEHTAGARFQRLRARIRVEQHAPLVMYHASDPFCGAGTPYATWSLSIELRPRDSEGKKPPEPLDNSAILRRIVPLLEALREPSAHGAPHVAAAVRDRLRELEIEEIVFLPVDGLPHRTHAPYAVEAFEEHRARSVEEGGETRRHFLRIRVGGWSEEVVATVFVRVHTQGGMLMLEVAPHVLRPVRPLFQEADRVAYRYRHNHYFGKAVWALGRTPWSAGDAIVTLVRGFGSAWRIVTSGNAKALADGPGLSVRELGSDDVASLFQDMDLSRYLKSVQDRVTSGVKLALKEAGYRTEEFEQKIVNIANGGTFIETAKGAVGIGNNNTITNTNTNTSSDTNARTAQTGGGARGND
jgi:hypothetical protein